MAFMDAEEDGGISDEGKDKGLMERQCSCTRYEKNSNHG
jgi:hypothetical protein